MNRSSRERVRLLGAVLIGVLVATTGDLGTGGTAGAAAAAPTSASSTSTSVSAPSSAPVASHPTVSIVAVSPQLPIPFGRTQQLKITVRLSNPTIATVDHLQLQVNRGDPITNEAGVAAAVVTPPPATDLDIAAVKVPGALTPQGQRQIVLTLIAGFDPATGLCLDCGRDGIYPVDVTLRSSAGVSLSRAHTLVPAFVTAPQPVRVGWVWPLIDRPHRTTSDSVFTDDDLAGSVATGGRLDRALKVAELVKNKVHLTLVIDPELIDSLIFMTHGYTVRTGTTKAAGTGGPAAAAWLRRLRAVAAYDDVSLTGYADPDVDALVRAGVEYSTPLAPQVSSRVAAVLGAHLSRDLAWPPAENLTSGGLDAVVASGATSVLLSDAALPGAAGRTSTPDAVSSLPSATGTDDALVLSSALQPTVLAATGPVATAADVRELSARLAVRAVAKPSVPHFAVLAPTRYVDPQPSMAAAAMLAVADAPWAQDISVSSALATVTPVDRGPLLPAGTADEVPAKQITTMITTRNQVAALRDCLTNQTAPTLLGGFAGGLARATSASWRTHPAAGQRFTNGLLSQIVGLEAKVSIQAPRGAHYTLASSDAPLEVTVRNDLSVAVRVAIRITALNGEQGFRAKQVPVQTIAAGAQQQIKVKTHVDRAGHFDIKISLLTPHNVALRRSRTIKVNSTALGAVALWITGIALGVLVLALAIRVIRRITRRGKPKPSRPARPDSAPSTRATGEPRPASTPGMSQ